MCRIVGFWHFTYKGEYDLKKTIISMRDVMKYGGPDDAGYYIEKDIGLALGHRRLSIIDISEAGHQPMKFDNLVIVYNGEVYNFKDIKEELEREGYSFNSNSDTEVVLKAFHKWGLDSVQKFRGMFAFAIWDKKSKKLILCRDRIGVKPIYWYYKNNIFIFASELKAFHMYQLFNKELNNVGLSLFLKYGYIPSPHSIFKNTYKLEPGYFLIIDEAGRIDKFQYWDIEKFFILGHKSKYEWLKKTEQELIEELESLLTESFKLRLISDVPVGVFLSGGIDSSTVCALLAKEGIKLKTFTIGFYEREYNEATFAKKVSEYLGAEHTELYCTPKEAVEIIYKLPEIYDEPFGDPSAIPTYMVSKLARNQIKVCLSADGGDEQFCGYDRYKLAVLGKFLRYPIRNFLYKIVNLINPETAYNIYKILIPILPKYTNFRGKYLKLRNVLRYDDILKWYDMSLSIFSDEDISRLEMNPVDNIVSRFTKISKKLDSISLLMLIDLKSYLPDDIFTKVDRATMSVSLENREPLADHKLIEWTSQMPTYFKYKDGNSKYILRKIIYKYLPRELLEKQKHGFSIPIYEWDEFNYLYIENLNEEEIKKSDLFNYDEIHKMLKALRQNKEVINKHQLWLLLVFELWRKKWLE